VHDLTPAAELLHGDEKVGYGDARFQGHCQESWDGRQHNAIQNGNATEQTPGSAGYT
jgi:hypothetical protein